MQSKVPQRLLKYYVIGHRVISKGIELGISILEKSIQIERKIFALTNSLSKADII